MRLYVLHPGESIYYDSIVPHQVRAHDGQKAKFLACRLHAVLSGGGIYDRREQDH